MQFVRYILRSVKPQQLIWVVNRVESARQSAACTQDRHLLAVTQL